MGYLADVVYDARVRKKHGEDPDLFEETTEIIANGETQASATRGIPRAPGSPGLVSSPVRDISSPGSWDRQISSSESDDPARLSDTPSPDVPQALTVNHSLHQHLLSLSQRTVDEKSQHILAQREGRDGLETGNQAQHPEATFDKQPPTVERSRENRGQTDLRPAGHAAPSPKPSEPGERTPVCDGSPSSHTSLIRNDTHIQHRTAPSTRLQNSEHTHIHNGIDQHRAVTTVSPPRQAAPKKPSAAHKKNGVSDSAPQLKIEQINVVVESARADEKKSVQLERDGDSSSSRYFLRSLYCPRCRHSPSSAGKSRILFAMVSTEAVTLCP